MSVSLRETEMGEAKTKKERKKFLYGKAVIILDVLYIVQYTSFGTANKRER